MGALVRSEKEKDATTEEDEAVLQGEQYLTFLVDNELFAIGIVDIKEIIEYRNPTTVPMMPPYLRGVINLRGRVVPVIDLLVRFGRESTEVSRRTCIVILEVYHDDEQQYLGVVVDAVKAVLDIADADIEPPPSFGAKLRNDFVSGMGKIDDEFVIILDIDHVLSIDELSMLSGIGEVSQSSAKKPHEAPDPELSDTSRQNQIADDPEQVSGDDSSDDEAECDEPD